MHIDSELEDDQFETKDESLIQYIDVIWPV